MEDATIGAAALRTFCTRALQRTGVPEAAARLCAEALVCADLRGVHSHGTLRLGVYVDRLRAGAIAATAAPRTVIDRGAVVVLDAQAGLGIPAAAAAADLACARALVHGICAVGVRNSHHCGMLAWYGLRAVASGCVLIAASNADAQVAPWGAREKYLGTNPIAIAIPGSEPPFVLDFATSVIAHGKIKAAAERGEPIPPDAALDREGRVTTDARAALDGALLTFGGAKGSGLSIAVEVLAGLLPGGLVGPEIVPLYLRLGQPQGVGHFFLALDPAAFGDADRFRQRCRQFFEGIRALAPRPDLPRVVLPGDLEHARSVRAEREGITLPADAVRELARVAAQLALPSPFSAC
ncbi:MAG: Ldh family oxidoreductase [Burkholderiaceae bacterium]|nr:Ldh family oxidoreductase [Burkholderiaceae bacterium]